MATGYMENKVLVYPFVLQVKRSFCPDLDKDTEIKTKKKSG